MGIVFDSQTVRNATLISLAIENKIQQRFRPAAPLILIPDAQPPCSESYSESSPES